MSMAVHCSCFLPPPNNSTISRRHKLFCRKLEALGSLASMSHNLKKLGLSICHASVGLFEICSMQAQSSMHPLHRDFQISKSVEVRDMISSSENQGLPISRFPAVAFLLANALMIANPLEALAEACETDESLLNMNMPVLLFVALIGATVGGLLARQRKGELERLNEQLRQINAALRRQAKIESYAPTLSYAPVGGRVAENEVIVDPTKEDLISRLKTGKNYLRNQEPEKAFPEFMGALELAQKLKDPTEEKKAARGLGASLQRQGKFREAIKYHSMVLSISDRQGEDSGNTEAYGAIADCYTELGDLEKAGRFYDKYISRLRSD